MKKTAKITIKVTHSKNGTDRPACQIGRGGCRWADKRIDPDNHPNPLWWCNHFQERLSVMRGEVFACRKCQDMLDILKIRVKKFEAPFDPF
jgi:hypothetical protein